jgi:glycosyltransferase involved in cell wall biosynthesis
MTKLMRLLHVVSSVDPQLGGVAESIRARGVELVKMGHQVEVVCLDEPDSTFINDYALPVHALGKGFTAWQFKPSLARWLKAHCQRFDAVIVDGLWQYHGIATRNALRGTGVPYYVLPHGMLDPWFKRTYPLKHLKKWLVWPWAEYRVLRDAAAVLFTCEEERLLASKSFWLYQANERVAPLGTNGPPGDGTALVQAFFSAFPNLREQPFLLFLGRVHPKKGCDILLEAFAQIGPEYPDQHLVMAGPASTRFLEKLKTQADIAGIADRVHWVGMLTGDTKWGALYASDAFVLPSHQENFGIAVVEALACGKPVLVSNKVNIWREAVLDACGLVAEDTAAGIAGLLCCWYEQSVANRAKLASFARESYQKRYTSQSAARTFLEGIAQPIAA